MNYHFLGTEVTENLARPVGATKSEALNPKSETNPNHQNSKFKTNITAYFDGGYDSRIPISSRKNRELKDCSTENKRQETGDRREKTEDRRGISDESGCSVYCDFA